MSDLLRGIFLSGRLIMALIIFQHSQCLPSGGAVQNNRLVRFCQAINRGAACGSYCKN